MPNRDKVLSLGFDAFNDASVFGIQGQKNGLLLITRKIIARLFKHPITYRYADAMKYWVHPEAKNIDTIPTIIPNWDHSPRSGAKGLILTDATPKLFKKHVEEIINQVKDKEEDKRIVFIKSWNEWGEGNYLEPDLQYGCERLEEFKAAIDNL